MRIDERIDRYDNIELAEMIDRYVRGEKARAIYKRRLIDRVKFEALAEEFDTSVRNVQNIVYSNTYNITQKPRALTLSVFCLKKYQEIFKNVLTFV